LHAQWTVQRQRVTHRALRAIRGDSINLTDESQCVFESRQTLGLNAIVVRNENVHDRIVAKKR
jgi:hypothetical protein